MTTDTRTRVFDYIIEYKNENDGNPPSVSTIMAALGISSKAVVKYHLDALEAEGLIVKRPGEQYILVVGAEWIPPTPALS